MSRSRTRASRFRRYDGGDPLAPPVDIAEALDAIGQDVMAGYSPERAMREFLRRGGRDQSGLDDLARRVAERRRELTQQHNLDVIDRNVVGWLETGDGGKQVTVRDLPQRDHIDVPVRESLIVELYSK